jgi:uncharacterized protein (DUF924 family)
VTDACDIAPADVMAFWREAGPDRWYERNQAFDAEVRRRYLALWRNAAAGELAAWEQSDDGALALVIVLDQFPRNMFRGDARAYSSDAMAQAAPSIAAPMPASRRTCANFSICP